jgi:hypothetical protein
MTGLAKLPRETLARESVNTCQSDAYSLGQVLADTARADQNVAEWRQYLPEDCVNAMIKNGWHHTV